MPSIREKPDEGGVISVITLGLIMKMLFKGVGLAFLILFSIDALSETAAFNGEIDQVYVFADEYDDLYAANYKNKIQIRFKNTPIALDGCDASHVIMKNGADDSNAGALYSTVLAALMSGKPINVLVGNNAPLFAGQCSLLWVSIIN